MPHTGVSLARTRDRKWSQPVSARRSIRPTSWPAAFAAAPTDASPWSMKLAWTLGRLLKLSKPGRAMPGKTRVTRIGGLLSLEERLQRACLGVPRERGGEAAVERVALVVADGGAEPGIGEASMDAVAVGEKEVHGLGHRRRARGWRLVTGREPQAGQLLDAEQLGEREHPVADRGRRVAGEVEDAGELYAERADECFDEVGDEDRLQQTRAEQRQRRPRRVVGEERAEEEVDEAEASRPVRVADARYERRNAGPFCEGGDLRLAVALGLAVRSRRPAGAPREASQRALGESGCRVTIVSRQPSPRRRVERWEPMNPVAPVTMTCPGIGWGVPKRMPGRCGVRRASFTSTRSERRPVRTGN